MRSPTLLLAATVDAERRRPLLPRIVAALPHLELRELDGLPHDVLPAGGPAIGT